MDEGSVGTRQVSSPLDVTTIQAAAVSWLALQTYSRYEDVLTVISDFRGKLSRVADETLKILDSVPARGLAEMHIAEARQAVEKNRYGSGLKGATDYSRHLANLLLSLCDIYQRATAE